MLLSNCDFIDATAFELYVLEKVCPIFDQGYSEELDLRDCDGAVISIGITDHVGASSVATLKDDLAPMLFGTAWKILDLSIELCLNKLTPRSSWQISEKKQKALNGEVRFEGLTRSRGIWRCICSVYAATVEHRHCLTHRTASVDQSSGEFNGVDRHGNAILPLSRACQIAMAKIAIIVARGFAEGGLSFRDEQNLKYQLDILQPHTNLPLFDVGIVGQSVNILMKLRPEGEDMILDIDGVLRRAEKILPGRVNFNLIIDIPGDTGRRLFAKAEDVPRAPTVINLSTLPSWLTYR